MSEQTIILSSKMAVSRRWLMLSVWDECPDTLPHLYQMENLERCDEVLEWLVRNKITGKKFIGFMKLEHDNSLLKTMSFILMKINRERSPRPLFAGKDWKS